jgi:hypothetical protein
MGGMPRRSLLTFTVTTLLLLIAFIVLERGFSPSFNECLSRQAFGPIAGAYISCTGTFIDVNSGGITALATCYRRLYGNVVARDQPSSQAD